MNSADIAAIEAIEDDIGTIADPAEFDRFYTGGTVLFDGLAPGNYTGVDAIKQAFGAQLVGVARVETTFHDRHVEVSGDLGVARSIQDLNVTMDDGSSRRVICRVTDILNRIAGEWKITHQHISYPIDPATGAGLFDFGA